MQSLCYVIITPARNEAAYIEKTIQSVASQTVLPAEWVIVDDGSTDETGAIIDRYAGAHHWIRGLHRKDRGFRKPAGGVMESFYDGFAFLGIKDFDFIAKFDADIVVDKRYFENCFERFRDDPKLGICGGGIYIESNGQIKLEDNPVFHVRGATKIYRRACWEAMGGLFKGPGWDTIDEVKANMLGWTTHTFNELKVVQLRETGSADGVWRNAIKDGIADYASGYHPLFVLIKYMFRVFRKPFFIRSFAQCIGFIRGYTMNLPREKEIRYLHYIRKQQLRKLLLRDSIWK